MVKYRTLGMHKLDTEKADTGRSPLRSVLHHTHAHLPSTHPILSQMSDIQSRCSRCLCSTSMARWTEGVTCVWRGFLASDVVRNDVIGTPNASNLRYPICARDLQLGMIAVGEQEPGRHFEPVNAIIASTKRRLGNTPNK